MIHKISRAFIAKVSVFGYFPLYIYKLYIKYKHVYAYIYRFRKP